eukprot:jgi/Mesvir1/21185/Mv08646-RA.1
MIVTSDPDAAVSTSSAGWMAKDQQERPPLFPYQRPPDPYHAPAPPPYPPRPYFPHPSPAAAETWAVPYHSAQQLPPTVPPPQPSPTLAPLPPARLTSPRPLVPYPVRPGSALAASSPSMALKMPVPPSSAPSAAARSETKRRSEDPWLHQFLDSLPAGDSRSTGKQGGDPGTPRGVRHAFHLRLQVVTACHMIQQLKSIVHLLEGHVPPSDPPEHCHVAEGRAVTQPPASRPQVARKRLHAGEANDGIRPGTATVDARGMDIAMATATAGEGDRTTLPTGCEDFIALGDEDLPRGERANTTEVEGRDEMEVEGRDEMEVEGTAEMEVEGGGGMGVEEGGDVVAADVVQAPRGADQGSLTAAHMAAHRDSGRGAAGNKRDIPSICPCGSTAEKGAEPDGLSHLESPWVPSPVLGLRLPHLAGRQHAGEGDNSRGNSGTGDSGAGASSRGYFNGDDCISVSSLLGRADSLRAGLVHLLGTLGVGGGMGGGAGATGGSEASVAAIRILDQGGAGEMKGAEAANGPQRAGSQASFSFEAGEAGLVASAAVGSRRPMLSSNANISSSSTSSAIQSSSTISSDSMIASAGGATLAAVQELLRRQHKREWRRNVRRRCAEQRAGERAKFCEADAKADEWRARCLAKEIARAREERQQLMAKEKAVEEKNARARKMELLIMAEKLDELLRLRKERMKRQGHVFPDEDNAFMEGLRRQAEEEQRDAAVSGAAATEPAPAHQPEEGELDTVTAVKVETTDERVGHFPFSLAQPSAQAPKTSAYATQATLPRDVDETPLATKPVCTASEGAVKSSTSGKTTPGEPNASIPGLQISSTTLRASQGLGVGKDDVSGERCSPLRPGPHLGEGEGEGHLAAKRSRLGLSGADQPVGDAPSVPSTQNLEGERVDAASVSQAAVDDFYFGAERDVGQLIQVRRAWDAFLVAQGGSRIPLTWVQPAPPSNSIWASYLTTAQR